MMMGASVWDVMPMGVEPSEIISPKVGGAKAQGCSEGKRMPHL